MNTFLLVFNALPTIIQSVQAVENAIPLPQSGQQKLNLILGAAGTAWELGQMVQHLPKSNTVTAIHNITNLTVESLNAAGVFRHAAPAATAASPA
ncbi:MAG: hypothetical protein M3N93_03650 [Acidobacteriota bacterium]|nr:hypothetical protein [Acidobacteriota bacterium]